jgi:hypothetical protein
VSQPEQRPYSRVYWEIVEDPRFAEVFGDDHHLSTWLRLLVAADSAWPTPVALPRSASEESVRVLSEAGLIELLAHDHYRVHGLDAERERRSGRARASANMRWSTAPAVQSESDGNAVALQPQCVDDAPHPETDASTSTSTSTRVSSPSSPSLRSEDSVDAQVSPRRTESEWLGFIVERDPAPRPGKTGRPLSVNAERISRLADYYEERFGAKFDARDGARLAALVKDTEGGYTAVMAAISEAAARDPKGDPLAYVQSILQRRNTRGEPARGNRSRPEDAAGRPDYDKLAAARLARDHGDAVSAA